MEEWKMGSTNVTVSDIDLDRTIKNMENGKCPAPRNINLLLTKYGGRKVLTLVTKVLNKILQGDNFS
jgi:hypothetical protein